MGGQPLLRLPMNKTQDERKGLPSASSVSRYIACPGSFKLERGCGEFRTDAEVAMAQSGDRIHAYIASDEEGCEDISEEEISLGNLCIEQEYDLIERIKASHDHFDVSLIEREKRRWLKSGKDNLLSGKPDAVQVGLEINDKEVIGFVTDYKTGYGDQADVEENSQIRTNIVLAAEQHPQVNIWYGAIIQPLVTDSPKLVKFTREHVLEARQELIELFNRMMDESAPRNAGLCCRWCPAVLKCPEAKALLQTFGMIDEDPDAAALSSYLVLAKAATPVIARLQSRAKQLLKDGANIPGWCLGNAQKMRSITDPFAAFAGMETEGLTREKFLPCVSVGVGDLEDAIYRVRKATDSKFTKKAAKELVNTKLEGVIEWWAKEAPLQQV
jgi:hypothetical protein